MELLIYNDNKFPCIRARLAQSVERWTLNPTVVGSSPTLGAILFIANVFHFAYSEYCISFQQV